MHPRKSSCSEICSDFLRHITFRLGGWTWTRRGLGRLKVRVMDVMFSFDHLISEGSLCIDLMPDPFRLNTIVSKQQLGRPIDDRVKVLNILRTRICSNDKGFLAVAHRYDVPFAKTGIFRPGVCENWHIFV